MKYEKKNKFNISFFYQIGIFLSYLLGVIDRKSSSKEIIKKRSGWYTKKYH